MEATRHSSWYLGIRMLQREAASWRYMEGFRQATLYPLLIPSSFRLIHGNHLTFSLTFPFFLRRCRRRHTRCNPALQGKRHILLLRFPTVALGVPMTQRDLFRPFGNSCSRNRCEYDNVKLGNKHPRSSADSKAVSHNPCLKEGQIRSWTNSV